MPNDLWRLDVIELIEHLGGLCEFSAVAGLDSQDETANDRGRVRRAFFSSLAIPTKGTLKVT
jgi:hypothetical protein